MKKFSVPSAYTIAMCIIFIAALLTWILPAGSYNYKNIVTNEVIPASKAVDEHNGPDRIIPIPGTYQTVKARPQGIGKILEAPIKGFYDSVTIIVFVLCIGGFLGIVNKTEALDSGISTLIMKFKGKESWLIAILTTLFSLGGVTFGMAEETLAFFPLLIPIMLIAGYDTFTAVLIILLGSGVGCLASIVTPFSIGIASSFMGISIGTGIITRIILYLLTLSASIFIILRYASRVKKNHAESIIADKKEELERHFLQNKEKQTFVEFDSKRKIILFFFIAVFCLYIYSVIPFDCLGITVIPTLNWSLTETSTCFAAGAILIGIIFRMKEYEIIENFLNGAKDFLGVAIIIGIARGISIILQNGLIIDTILNSSVNVIKIYSTYTCLYLIYAVHLLLSLFITSSSGLATITMPIMNPLSTFIHIPKELIITAYTSASGLINLFAPTSAVVMGCIILGKIPYTRFLKFIIPKCLIFLLITIVVLTVSLYLDILLKLH